MAQRAAKRASVKLARSGMPSAGAHDEAAITRPEHPAAADLTAAGVYPWFDTVVSVAEPV